MPKKKSGKTHQVKCNKCGHTITMDDSYWKRIHAGAAAKLTCPKCKAGIQLSGPTDAFHTKGAPMVPEGRSVQITLSQLRQIIKEEVQRAKSRLAEISDEDFYGDDYDDGYGDMDFRDPGGRSSLRAGKLEFPCPTCGAENVLTAKDVRLGYQCDDCADRVEGRSGY